MDYSKLDFASLKIECREKGIEVTQKDTPETLLKKLSPKSDKSKK